jgi:hypothetical protein
MREYAIDLKRVRKIVKEEPHILDSLPLFYRMVVMRLIGELGRENGRD